LHSDLTTEIITKVFPSGSESCWNTKEVEERDRLWIIHNKEGPRWIVPQNPKYGWPVLSQWHPYDMTSRLKWTVLMAAYRTGKLGLLPGVVGVGVIRCPDGRWDHLGWPNKTSPVPTIYIGTNGPTRKAVAQLVDVSNGQIVAVAKAPLGVWSAKNILHEADILKAVEKEKQGVAPYILYDDRTTCISLQNFISGRSSYCRLTSAHIDLLASFHRTMVETSLSEQSARLMKHLFQLEGLEQETLHLLKKILDQLNDPSPLPAFWTHNDFAPWNLRWVGEGKLVAVDWEDSMETGLPAVDLIYFHLIQDFLFSKYPPYKMWKRLNRIKNCRLTQSYIEKFCYVKTLFKSLVLFTLTELFIRRSLVLNASTDRFCRYLKTLIKEPIDNL
jgi:hypothetical protein